MQRLRPLFIGLTGLLVACTAANTDSPDARDAGKGGAVGMPNASGAAGMEPALTEMPFDAPATGYVEMNLYPGDPPNYLATAPPESVDATTGAIADVAVPTLRRYPFDASQATGVAFVSFPGGGYNVVDMERQATALAARLGPLGISVFGVKYRVGAGSTDVPRDALLDAQRALRLVRSHARAWHVDASRIGTVSFSAGSHLALMVAGHFDAGALASADPVERVSSRPDFMAVLSVASDGETESPFSFTPATPPIFMAHAEDDMTAPIALARAVEQQLQALGILEHLEVYPSGGHSAFNVGNPSAEGRDWPDKYLPWLRTNQLLP